MDRSPRIVPAHALAAGLAVGAGLAVFLIASTVFPYHSSNHDEAVYLQQAAMLLDGQLQLYAGDLVDVFRPWFFVEDGGRLYPKYAPVPAAMFALSMALFSEPRVTLAAVAAGNVALVYLLGVSLFDRRVGLLAGTVFAISPMTLATTSVFLPYAPTTLLNLVFAVCYVHSVRERRRDLAALAGVAIGIAFFARPYTAILFALPFIGHALWTVIGSVRARWTTRSSPAAGDRSNRLPEPIVRNGLIAALGLAGVAVALAYNAHLTGSPLVFPYEAFAPQDGPGFGHREILGHGVEYTPSLALRANGYALWFLVTRWFTAGPIGTLFALAGAAIAVRRVRRGRLLGTGFGVAILLGVVVSVVVGNVPFWGTHNLLGTLSDPTDGLVAQFGPFYHFDLLVPLSIFAAVGVVAAGERLRKAIRTRTTTRRARLLLLLVLAISLPVVGVANAGLVTTPLDRSAAYTEKYEQAYAPFDERSEDFENALVFLPTPYGAWQNHPFQYLRNEPGFDGEVVYALHRSPASRFDVLDSYPDREYYRYTYRGEWTPNPDQHVTPKLERLSVREGSQLDGHTRVGVPDRVQSARVRLMTGEGERSGERATYSIAEPGETIEVEWTVNGEGAQLTAVDGSTVDDRRTVPFADADEIVLTITLVQPDGSTLTYRQEAAVKPTDDGVEVIWPPERSVCPLVTDCSREGTYLPDRPDVHRDGVSFEAELTAE